ENGLLKVTARELGTGITQEVEVRPSYGLSDEEVERMLIDALDHGEQDFEARRLVDARVEAERLLLATEKALAADADLLEPDEQESVTRAVARLRAAAARPDGNASAIQAEIGALDDATHAWAGRRMNRAVASAIAGRAVSDVERRVEHAAGVDAHLAAHASREGR
ncbi:MAG TPA: Hsp70 family protein, partial [Polyangiaceae bacterium]